MWSMYRKAISMQGERVVRTNVDLSHYVLCKYSSKSTLLLLCRQLTFTKIYCPVIKDVFWTITNFDNETSCFTQCVATGFYSTFVSIRVFVLNSWYFSLHPRTCGWPAACRPLIFRRPPAIYRRSMTQWRPTTKTTYNCVRNSYIEICSFHHLIKKIERINYVNEVVFSFQFSFFSQLCSFFSLYFFGFSIGWLCPKQVLWRESDFQYP